MWIPGTAWEEYCKLLIYVGTVIVKCNFKEKSGCNA